MLEKMPTSSQNQPYRTETFNKNKKKTLEIREEDTNFFWASNASLDGDKDSQCFMVVRGEV